jgi:hypothetical protein
MRLTLRGLVVLRHKLAEGGSDDAVEIAAAVH